jgi:predicted NBD/HSP70 family sugar kinase
MKNPHIDLGKYNRPPLDPDFIPAALWNRSYQSKAQEKGSKDRVVIALERSEGDISTFQTTTLPYQSPWIELTDFYVERLLKYLLWQRGGHRITISGNPQLTSKLEHVYSRGGARSFDFELIGEKVYLNPLKVESTPLAETPGSAETHSSLGGHFDGCRIGFDLGGSDRKCAAVMDGHVVHSEEVQWDPYFQEDPRWHYTGINDSLQRAASKLPRVDSIGGSAAGVYVDNEVRAASLFRGVSSKLFHSQVRPIFKTLQREWDNVPFVVVNDGEVTALAGSMSLGKNGVLGIAMGTSLAAGYVTPGGTITSWLNELAFVPVDYRADAPVDEWSGDRGVGAQYMSQQAVGRLIDPAGIQIDTSLPLPEKLVAVQELMEKGDGRARRIFETIGVYFAYSIAQHAQFYEIENLLVLGRVMSGAGGDALLRTARQTLSKEFPEVAEAVQLVTPGETEKRHGQAVAAASLPQLDG